MIKYLLIALVSLSCAVQAQTYYVSEFSKQLFRNGNDVGWRNMLKIDTNGISVYDFNVLSNSFGVLSNEFNILSNQFSVYVSTNTGGGGSYTVTNSGSGLTLIAGSNATSTTLKSLGNNTNVVVNNVDSNNISFTVTNVMRNPVLQRKWVYAYPQESGTDFNIVGGTMSISGGGAYVFPTATNKSQTQFQSSTAGGTSQAGICIPVQGSPASLRSGNGLYAAIKFKLVPTNFVNVWIGFSDASTSNPMTNYHPASINYAGLGYYSTQTTNDPGFTNKFLLIAGNATSGFQTRVNAGAGDTSSHTLEIIEDNVNNVWTLWFDRTTSVSCTSTAQPNVGVNMFFRAFVGTWENASKNIFIDSVYIEQDP